MPRHNIAKPRTAKRAPRAPIIAASVITITNPAVNARPAGCRGDRPVAPTPICVTADLPADYCRHTQPWPLVEDDIDLPDDPPPAPEPLLSASHYVGSIHASLHAAFIAIGEVDFDVMIHRPDTVAIGPLRLTREQALKLCRLLLVAVNVSEDSGVTA